MPATLELREWEPRRVEMPLGEAELAALRAAHIGVTPLGGARYELRPSSHVGALRVGETSIVVRPKIDAARAMFLISYAIDPRHWREDDTALERDADVPDAIAAAFARETRRAIGRGLLRGYRREEDALHGVRGRVRFADQLRRRPGVPLPVEVAFDEFTADVEENRLLHAALRLLARMPLRSEDARRGLRALLPRFEGVEAPPYRRGGAPDIAWTRLNAHYRRAVALARLVVEWSSLELRGGETAAAAFLIDMNDVFERFVRTALREALGLAEAAWPEPDGVKRRRLTLDEAGAIRLVPDLLWLDGGAPVFAGDAKYKRTEGDAAARHGDIYQMLAYCTAAGLPLGLLVYAQGEDEPARHAVRRAGVTIEVDTLALGGGPDAILASVARLARGIKERRDGRLAAA